MIRKLTATLCLSIAVLFGSVGVDSSAANSKDPVPLWEKTKILVCRGDYRFTHSETDSSKGESTALWSIDFPNSKITRLTDGVISEIRDKYFKASFGADTHVISFDGRMMNFHLDPQSPPINVASGIKMTVTDSSWTNGGSQTLVHIYTCYPQ